MKKALILGLLVVMVVAFSGCDWLQKEEGEEQVNSSEVLTTNEVVNENINASEEINISDWLIYENETMGFSFKYPSNWEVVEGSSVDPVTRGDIMKNDEIFTSFNITLKTLESDSDSKFIGISHTYLDYDNMGIENQFNKIKCSNLLSEVIIECEENNSKHGTKYVEFLSSGLVDNNLQVLIPTGDYIMSFTLDNRFSIKEVSPEIIEAFNGVIQSVKLIN